MKQTDPQPNTRNIDAILAALSEAPSLPEVTASFTETLTSVTKLSLERIPERAHTESRIISPYLMHLSQKTIGLGIGALALVLIIGYATFGNSSPYEDIMSAALDDESAYEMAQSGDESFDDLNEDDTDTSLTTTDTSTSGGSVSIDSSLATIETLFATDDIDDSGMSSWFSDTTASDALIESYNI